jgi:hypothetical protein
MNSLVQLYKDSPKVEHENRIMHCNACNKNWLGTPGGKCAICNYSLVDDPVQKLQAWIRERSHGECKILSKGIDCECALCLLGEILATAVNGDYEDYNA